MPNKNIHQTANKPPFFFEFICAAGDVGRSRRLASPGIAALTSSAIRFPIDV
jgi:hypothetical protein